MPNTPQTPSTALTEAFIEEMANRFKIDKNLLKAMIVTHFPEPGFQPDGRVKVRFHRHLFWKYTIGRAGSIMAKWRYQALALMNQDIMLPNPEQPFPVNYNSERIKLEKALKINRGAALLSASRGRFMLAGEQFNNAGFENIEQFVEAIEKNENEQFRAFLTYLQSVVYDGKNLLIHLKENSFQKFAAGFPKHENEPEFNLKLFIKNHYCPVKIT